MSPEQTAKAQQLFLEVVHLQANDQRILMQSLSENEPAMATYVQALLDANKQSENFFAELEDTITSSNLNEIEEYYFRDVQIGHYKIKHILKQGGMGSIFLARRADGEFNREVVVKMIPIGMGFEQNQLRFTEEKAILASLIHPNIVQLYDSGVTEKGHPYFVMEYVDGNHIIEYCHTQQLNLARRIELFKQILSAVQFAHQHLIIHDDIKPSNIMVNKEGQVKLLDFGIAKLLRSNTPITTVYSIEYQTPEHVDKQSITTSTDIHQLGQLLYEMLTGMTPKHVRTTDFSYPKLIDTIKKRHLNGTLSVWLKSTASSQSQLKKIYQSDIQLILSKALQSKQQLRYSTVQNFIDDLNNYQRNYCVSAHSWTLGYRLQKYLQRNVLLVGFISLLIVLLAGFVWITVHHNQVLSNERDKAVTVKNLLVEVFSVANPAISPGRVPTAIEALDIGLEKIRKKFDTATEIEADLLEGIAQTYQSLGNYSKAQIILQDAYAIRTNIQAADYQIVSHSMMLLGENQRLLSNHDEAESWLNQSLQLLLTHPKENPTELALIKSKLGRVKMLQGDLDEAQRLALEAVASLAKIYGENNMLYVQSMNDLSSVYFRQGKYPQVQEILSKTKLIRENLWPDQPLPILDRDYATNLNNLGLAYYLQGDLITAQDYFLQAIDLRKQIYSVPHPEQAQSLTNLGLLLNDAGKPDQALVHLQQALAIREATLAPGHMLISDARNNLAMAYHENAEFYNAINIYQETIANIITKRGEEHPQTVALFTNMANTYLELNDLNQANEYFNRSLLAREKSLPAGHLYLSYNYIGLGRTKLAMGNVEAGKQLIEKGLEIRKQKLPAEHWLLGEAYYASALADFLASKINPAKTQKACDILQQSKGLNNILTKKCHALLTQITHPETP